MHFLINPAVLAAHPDIAIGVIVATNLQNVANEKTAALLQAAEDAARRVHTIDTFKDHPNLVAMQAVHRSFGNNPNKFPPSVQALLKRVLKGGNLPSINPLVDLYNVISLRHVVCVGAEDMDRCTGDVQLTFATGTEQFIPLGETVEDPPLAGEMVYSDDAGVICRKLNWREGDRAKITHETKNAIVVVEGFPPMTKDRLKEILEELASLVREYCRAETRIEILDREHSSLPQAECPL